MVGGACVGVGGGGGWGLPFLQVLQGIKILKLYCWEDSYQARVEAMRAREVLIIRRMNFLESLLVRVPMKAGCWVRLVCFGSAGLRTRLSQARNKAQVGPDDAVASIQRGLGAKLGMSTAAWLLLLMCALAPVVRVCSCPR